MVPVVSMRWQRQPHANARPGALDLLYLRGLLGCSSHHKLRLEVLLLELRLQVLLLELRLQDQVLLLELRLEVLLLQLRLKFSLLELVLEVILDHFCL